MAESAILNFGEQAGEDAMGYHEDEMEIRAGTAPDAIAGKLDFWVRANPVQAKLSSQLNGGAKTAIDLTRSTREQTNVAADGKPDLRFLAWVKADRVTLNAGTHTIRFRRDSGNSHHGYFDCFVFANKPFTPRGVMKPGELAAAAAQEASTNACWFPFELGFKGLISASNWATASPEVLGPLEKLSYLPGDFIDRHG